MQPVPVNPLYFFASLALLFWLGYWKASRDAEAEKKRCAEHEHPPYPDDDAPLCWCGARHYRKPEPKPWTN